MPATYEPIASTTVSAASDVTFSSIPGTYTDLILVWGGSCTGGPVIGQVNSDTGTNYSDTYLLGNGSAASSGRYSTQGAFRIQISQGTGQTVARVSIQSYANTSVFKTMLSESAAAGSAVERTVSLWRSTSAITSVKFYPFTGTLTGTLSLYGIKAA